MYAATNTLTQGITPYIATEAVIAGKVCSADVTYVEGNNGPGYEVLAGQAPGLPSGFEAFVSADDACFDDSGLLSVPSSALPEHSSPQSRAPLIAQKLPRREITRTVELDAISLEELAHETH